MKQFLFSLLVGLSCVGCQQQADVHQGPTHNFTVNRLIVLNDNDEILMGMEDSNWYSLVYLHDRRQFVNEALDSLATAYGIKISPPELRAYVSYKYEYHPYATLRGYYVARYLSGTPKPAGQDTEMRWIPIAEVIELTPVESMKMITKQVLSAPDTLWGASFMVYEVGEEHHTRLVEGFYPLFTGK